MSTLPSLHLDLLECQELLSADNVYGAVEHVARRGFRPGIGAWTIHGAFPEPVNFDKLPDLVNANRWVTPAGEREQSGHSVGLSSSLEVWRFGVVRTTHPQVFSNLTVSHRPGNRWDIGIMVLSSSHAKAGLSLEDFASSWVPFLEYLGRDLFVRMRPAIAMLTNSADAIAGFPTAVAQRRLILGWRSWFGSPYVDAFGRQFLLNLPDVAEPLDGGIEHRLAASSKQFVEGQRGLYTGVRAYLKRQGVGAAWPQVKAGASMTAPSNDEELAAGREDVDRELTDFRRTLAELLSITTVLAGGTRVKFLGLNWSELVDAPIGQQKRALLLHSIREAADQELRDHPDARIRFELGQDPPDELRQLMDELVGTNTRITYVVLRPTE